MRSVVVAALLVGGLAVAKGTDHGGSRRHAKPARPTVLVKVPVPDLGQTCDDLDLAALAEALDVQAQMLSGEQGSLEIGEHTVSKAEYADKTLRVLAGLARAGDGFCAQLGQRFEFYANPGAGDGKFTVYHNPVVRGSRTRTDTFRHPLYRHPQGRLAALTTKQILSGGLDDQGLELVWLDDLTLVNELHIEGSATVQLEDGSSLRVTCDGSNGKHYQNVGKLLLADKRIPREQVTPLGMTRSRKYFLDHPEELPVYWARNPHYVFFKETDDEGRGAFGALVPGRSVAVDTQFVPIGSALWITSDKPVFNDDRVDTWAPYGRVALGQDRGAAILGAGRVDVFFGTGDYAAAAAAVTNRPGKIYVLLAK